MMFLQMEYNLEILLETIQAACVMAVVAYLLFRSPLLCRWRRDRHQLSSQLGISLAVIAASGYGLLQTIQLEGRYITMPFAAPMTAGFLAGPWAGILTGFLMPLPQFFLGNTFHSPEFFFLSILSGTAAGLYTNFTPRGKVGGRESALVAGLFTAIAILGGISFHLLSEDTAAYLIVISLGHSILVGTFIGINQKLRQEEEDREVRERIESELALARKIQLDLIPPDFSFLAGTGWEACACLEPAREVGGDFYDMVLLDSQRLCFWIGDVSGKSIPAALLVASTRSLIRALLTPSSHLPELLGKVNNHLCADNPSGMFVTFFIAILDMKTGHLAYTNCGHPPPFITQKNTLPQKLAIGHGPPLGVIPDLDYQFAETILTADSSLVLYTDGITEARSPSGSFYTLGRLGKTIGQCPPASSQKLFDCLHQEIHDFAATAPQSDDIALMVISHSLAPDSQPSL